MFNHLSLAVEHEGKYVLFGSIPWVKSIISIFYQIHVFCTLNFRFYHSEMQLALQRTSSFSLLLLYNNSDKKSSNNKAFKSMQKISYPIFLALYSIHLIMRQLWNYSEQNKSGYAYQKKTQSEGKRSHNHHLSSQCEICCWKVIPQTLLSNQVWKVECRCKIFTWWGVNYLMKDKFIKNF